jgi:hypothetical protein
MIYIIEKKLNNKLNEKYQCFMIIHSYLLLKFDIFIIITLKITPI